MFMEKRVYEYESKEKAAVQGVLEAEPYEKRSFARQGYKVKDGKIVGGEEGKTYLYIDADADFLKWAEEKIALAKFASFKRTAKDVEAKIITHIEAEDNAAEAGFGAIFG
jgi:hypothetical protein